VEERGVLGGLRTGHDAAPHGELRGGLTLLTVPAREDAERRGVLLRAGEKIVDRLGARAERTAHVGSSDAGRAQLRKVLEREVVDALCFAEVASPRAETAEADVRLLAGRVERDGLGVATQREVFLVGGLVRARDVHEIEGAGGVRGGRRAEHERACADAADDEGSAKPAGRAPHARQDSAIVPLMWPFGRNKVGSRLGAASAGAGDGPTAPAPVSTLTTLVSPPGVVSPFTGMRACIVVIELCERIPLTNDSGAGSEVVTDRYDSLGFVVLGDVATLRDEDGDEITIVVHRARIEPALHARGGTPISRAPAEVVPLLRKATGRGVVCYRELTLGTGDSIRLKAVVEPSTSVVASGYRSGTRRTYVARDDLAPVVLEELFEAPPW